MDNVHGVEGSEDGCVMHDEVVHADGCDEGEPHRDAGRKGVADFVGAKPLHGEEQDKDGHGDPDHLHCSKTTTRKVVQALG
jgi:hypothetical protein